MPEQTQLPSAAGVVRRAFEWLNRRRLVGVSTLFVLVAGAWGFIELADDVLEGDTQAFDVAVLTAVRNAVNNEAYGLSWLPSAADDVTALGSAAVLVIFTLVATGYLALVRDYFAAALLLVATWTGQVVCLALKYSLNRARPNVVPHFDEVITSSFPSGHSMMAAVVYLTLGVTIANFVRGRRLKSYIVGVAVTLTLLVGVSRVVVGVHYPTDVLAGWTAGLVWAVLCGLLLGTLKRHWPRKRLPLKGDSG